MRLRLPTILICLTLLAAMVAAGCGSDQPEVESLNQTTSSGSSKGGSSAGDAALKGAGADSSSSSGQSVAPSGNYAGAYRSAALKSCLKVASDLDDKSQVAAAKQHCRDAFGKNSNAQKSVNNAMKQAYAQCKQAAANIPDENAKRMTLQTCAKFK